MPRVGKRPGSGRPPGSTTRKTREIANAIMNRGDLTPLDYMLAVLKDPKAEQNRRDEMARHAAAYVHPKLSAVAIGDASGKSMTIAAVNVISIPHEFFLTREAADKDYRFRNEMEGSLTITPVWTSPTLVTDHDRDLIVVEASSNDDAA